MILRALILGLLCLQQPAIAQPDEHFNIWTFSIFSPEIDRRRVAPFIDELATAVKAYPVVSPSNDIGGLLTKCRTNNYNLIIAPETIGKKVLATCDYQVIATTFQNITLFATTESSQTLVDLKNIGIVRNTKASHIALNELPELIPDFNPFLYMNFFSLVKNINTQAIDAWVTTKSIQQQLKTKPNWRAVHTFKEQGQVLLMIPKTLNKKTKLALTDYLFANKNIPNQALQETYGLGDFLKP